MATNCRKCGVGFETYEQRIVNRLKKNSYAKNLTTYTESIKLLTNYINSEDVKIISLTGPKGCGKSSVIEQVKKDLSDECIWGVGNCSSYSQITPGGVLQNLLLNLFNLPKYYSDSEELKNSVLKIFTNEFKFLNSNEISDFVNFLYPYQNGDYEQIVANKKYMFNILYKVFCALIKAGRCVLVLDNFDYIDGFSSEFITGLVVQKNIFKDLKLIFTYKKSRSVINYFIKCDLDIKFFADINIAPLTYEEIENIFNIEGYSDTVISERDKYFIAEKCQGNPAYIEQSVFYCFDCQVANKEFALTEDFDSLVEARLKTLMSNYLDAFRILGAAAILKDKIQPSLLCQIFQIEIDEILEILSYLCESRFLKKQNEDYYEFQNTYLWECILNKLREFKEFEGINIHTAKALSAYNLNTDQVFAGISQNLKEYRLAFDIWTKIARMSAYVGDVNLYIVCQKQCLALLNEFNENETLTIRYNISERLGKLLTEYDPESAVEFLPDAISNARTQGDDKKEIELLGYLALCCKKIGNYFGDIECADNALKKISDNGQELEVALVKSTKVASLLKIGNCGEVINLIDNDILPKLNAQLEYPKLDKLIPLDLIYDTKVKSTLYLAQALALQGNNRVFEVLSNLSDLIKKHSMPNDVIVCKIKLIQAFVNTMKGDYKKSNELLQNIMAEYGEEYSQINDLDKNRTEIINNYSIIYAVNKIMQKDYQDIQEELFDAVSFANDTGDIYAKHIYKALLGKVFYDQHQAKRAIDIYNEEIVYFAEEKFAIGALLTWYLIVQATFITQTPQKCIEIAEKALEIAQNPRINNYFFIVLIKTLIAKAYLELSDYETTKMNIESAIVLAKKYEMNDLLAKLYLLYGQYYRLLGSTPSQNKSEYLKGANVMFDRALEIVDTITYNMFLRKQIEEIKNNITFC
ncbi:MAG: ATP-binding protein [Cyanobacteria bacterium SIG26]|nr:ATP-binding protein [Cyanobacteria bacterium SIG26]